MADQTSKIAALPGLRGLGQKTAEDATKAGVPPITVKLNLPIDGWRAFDHLPDGYSKSDVTADAQSLADNADLNNLSFLQWVKQQGADETGTIDNMLESVRARNAGEAGKHVLDIVTRCRDLGKQVPHPSPKFVAKFNQGLATAAEVLDNVKWLSKQLEHFVRSFETLKDLVDQEEQYHMNQAQLSFEACARDLQISEEENDREEKMIYVTAVLEELERLLGEKLAGQLTEEDQTRIQNVEILVQARLKNMRPMIQKANLSAKRFASQSNANALTCLDQLDFAREGLAAWKADIVAQLDAVQNIAFNQAYLAGIEFTDEQARATADAYTEQMKSMAQVMATQMQSMETIQYVTDALVEGCNIMAQGFSDSKDKEVEASKVITKTKSEVTAAQDQFKKSILDTLRRQGVNKADAQAVAA